MLAVIKKQRDATNFTLYRIVVLIVILVMNIFLHSVLRSPKRRRSHSSGQIRMHH